MYQKTYLFFHQSLLSSVGLERLTVIVRLSSEGPLFDSERGDFLFALLMTSTLATNLTTAICVVRFGLVHFSNIL
jgi:hypothetical protein